MVDLHTTSNAAKRMGKTEGQRRVMNAEAPAHPAALKGSQQRNDNRPMDPAKGDPTPPRIAPCTDRRDYQSSTEPKQDAPALSFPTTADAQRTPHTFRSVTQNKTPRNADHPKEEILVHHSILKHLRPSKTHHPSVKESGGSGIHLHSPEWKEEISGRNPFADSKAPPERVRRDAEEKEPPRAHIICAPRRETRNANDKVRAIAKAHSSMHNRRPVFQQNRNLVWAVRLQGHTTADGSSQQLRDRQQHTTGNSPWAVADKPPTVPQDPSIATGRRSTASGRTVRAQRRARTLLWGGAHNTAMAHPQTRLAAVALPQPRGLGKWHRRRVSSTRYGRCGCDLCRLFFVRTCSLTSLGRFHNHFSFPVTNCSTFQCVCQIWPPPERQRARLHEEKVTTLPNHSSCLL